MREYQLFWKWMGNNSFHVNDEIAVMKIGNLFEKNAILVDDDTQ